MNKKHDKLMTDFQRLLGTQDFKSEEALRNYMESMLGQQTPSFNLQGLNAAPQFTISSF